MTHTPQPLVCATRASALATWQSNSVMETLREAGLPSAMLTVKTIGDTVVDRPLAAIGTEGVFVKELERALREGRADYAVHSSKDLPSALPDDMTIAAFGRREDPRDVLCSERYPSFDELPPGAVIGTSSPRRRAQLQARRPDLHFRDIRGNIDTRLRKLGEGSDYDAIVLAYAGLRRLGLAARYTVPFPLDVLVPAVGQGALAIEMRAGHPFAQRFTDILGDAQTALAVSAERAFLRAVRGGCQAPIGAHARFSGGRLIVRAVIAVTDGSEMLELEHGTVVSDDAGARSLGEHVANELFARGAERLMSRGASEPSA